MGFDMQTQPITTPKIYQLLTTYSNDNTFLSLPAGWVARIVREVQGDEHGYLCNATEMQRISASVEPDLDNRAAQWASDTALAIVELEDPDTVPTLTEILSAAKILADYYWFEYGIPQPQVG